MVHGFWLSVMGYLSWFYVEANAFELSVANGGKFYSSLKGTEGSPE
jgi:hypothetical protein